MQSEPAHAEQTLLRTLSRALYKKILLLSTIIQCRLHLNARDIKHPHISAAVFPLTSADITTPNAANGICVFTEHINAIPIGYVSSTVSAPAKRYPQMQYRQTVNTFLGLVPVIL